MLMKIVFPTPRLRSVALVSAGLSLAACSANVTTFNQPFGNPLPRGQINSTTVSVPPREPLPVVTEAPGGKPTVVINAPTARVQEAIIERARSRGTTVVGANQTGVTLERALPSSTPVLEASCGPHQQGRSVRIYLATQGSATQTVVTEERFVIDPGPRVCAVNLPPADVEEANRALGDLKSQAEASRTAARTNRGASSGAGGGVQPVVAGRPVVPLR
jgi:hypothetical protein